MTGRLKAARRLVRQLRTPPLGPWQRLFRDNLDDRDDPAGWLPAGRLRAMFLGVSTVLLDDGDTAVLTDGFFSRPSIVSTLARPIRPDRRRITAALQRAGIDRLAAVFVAHSHYDHALDAPHVASLTGATLLGSDSTAQIAAGYGFPGDRMRVVTSGEPMRFGAFTLTALPAVHSPGDLAPGCICEPLAPPAGWRAFRTGECYSLHIRHDGHAVIVHASANYVPDALAGHRADTVFLGIGALGKQSDEFRDRYWHETVTLPGARTVIPIHWDNFTRRLDRPMVPLPTVFDDFPTTMRFLEQRCARDGIGLMLPTPFRTIPLTAAPSTPGAGP